MFDVKGQEWANKNLTYSGHWLHYWEETIGPFQEIWKEGCLLIAKIGEKTLILPNELEKALAPLVGQTISILRTDLPEKEWLFRVIPDSRQKTESMNAQDHYEDEQSSNCCEVM